MRWTFGIITDGTQDERIQQIISGINQLEPELSDFEILIVGNSEVKGERTRVIPFDESQKEGWITRKKNIIAEEAKFECLSISHDYVFYDQGWGLAYEAFGEDWNVSMTQVLNPNGQRHLDWIGWAPVMFIPYDVENFTEHMYVSGAYFNVKRDFFLTHPMNEEVVWPYAEDVEWSLRIRDHWNYRLNAAARVRLLKTKETPAQDFNPDFLSSSLWMSEFPYRL